MVLRRGTMHDPHSHRAARLQLQLETELGAEFGRGRTVQQRSAEEPGSRDWYREAVLQDIFRRSDLLNRARNLRFRAEAEFRRATDDETKGPHAQQIDGLRKALWIIRAARRMQDQAAQGLGLPPQELHPEALAGSLLDVTYPFRGLQDEPSRCRIRIYQRHAEPTIVIATELPDNPGTSITRHAEHLAIEIRALLQPSAHGLLWIEHCPQRGAQPHEQETFALVRFSWTGTRFVQPSRQVLPRYAVEHLIGGLLEEELSE